MVKNSLDVCEEFQNQYSFNLFQPLSHHLLALVPLTYAVPSIIMGITIVLFLSSKKGRKMFKGSFYFFFAFGIVVDIIVWLINYYGLRLAVAPMANALYEWVPRNGFSVRLLYFFISFFGIAAYLKCLVLSFNRLTAIIFPVHYEEIWAKYSSSVLLFYITFPIFFSWNYLVWDEMHHCRILLPNTTTGYINLFIMDTAFHWIPLFAGITFVAFTVSIITLVIHIITVAKLVKQRKRVKNITYGSNINVEVLKSKEIKLFIISLVLFTIGLFDGIFFAFLAVLSINSIREFFGIISINIDAILDILPFLSDLSCLLSPWIFIILNKNFRRELFGSLVNKFRKSSTNIVTPMYKIKVEK